MKYRIKKIWRCGERRWLVLQGEKEVARFAYKFEAVAWILTQEKKS